MNQRVAFGTSVLGSLLAMASSSCTPKEPNAPGAQAAVTAPSAEPGNPASGSPMSSGTAAADAPVTDLASATRERPLKPERPPGPTVNNNAGAPPEGPPRFDSLHLPPGFSIELYSAAVPNARSLALGANGTVFVSTRSDDKVYALVDKNGDHRVDAVHVVAQGLPSPNGIAYRDGALFIAQVRRLLRIDGIDDQLEHPPQPVVLNDALPDKEHHGWRFLRFGPDGWLYMPVGAPCNVCLRDEPIFSTIVRMHPDGTGLEVFARGVRNSVGFDWHPETKELWFSENGRDELGDDLPPDELNRASRAGLHFGYPHCHAGVISDPEYGKEHPCTEFEPPAQKLGAHAAALGMRFYTGKMFPPEYKNAILLAEHGSWNRSKKNGYRVALLKLRGNEVASYEPFISGWLDEATDRVTGRPVDVEVLDDGSLLVSDDWRGAVYRVTYRK